MNRINPIYWAAAFQIGGMIVCAFVDLEVPFIIGSVAYWVLLTNFHRRRLTRGDLFFARYGLLVFFVLLVAFYAILRSFTHPIH